eukprot:127206-Chlamydomonas_euryale.AAC.1
MQGAHDRKQRTRSQTDPVAYDQRGALPFYDVHDDAKGRKHALTCFAEVYKGTQFPGRHRKNWASVIFRRWQIWGPGCINCCLSLNKTSPNIKRNVL